MWIAESLKQNTTLEFLNMYANMIGDEGAMWIAESLKQNCFLAITELNLGGNDLGDDGIKALAKGLETNTSIQSLCLEECNCGIVGFEALKNAMLNRNGMKRICVSIIDLEQYEMIDRYHTHYPVASSLFFDTGGAQSDTGLEWGYLLHALKPVRTLDERIFCCCSELGNEPYWFW